MNENYTVFSAQAEIVGELHGIVTLPENFDKTKEHLPMIVFLHGSGERGQDAQRVCVQGIPKYFTQNPDYMGQRVITISPQCPENTTWQHIPYSLMSYIKAAVKEYNVDENRISLTGLSMGGFGTWNMLTLFPEYFSCAAPICGGGVPWHTADTTALKGFPIRAFHGTADESVLVSNSVDMTNAAVKAGANVELTLFPGVGHNSWDKAYEETDLITWLVSH